MKYIVTYKIPCNGGKFYIYERKGFKRKKDGLEFIEQVKTYYPKYEVIGIEKR